MATVGCGVFRVTLGGTASQPSIRGVEQLHFNDELEIKNFFFTLYPENGSAMWFGNRGGGAVRYDIAGGGSEVFKFDAGAAPSPTTSSPSTAAATAPCGSAQAAG